MVYVSCSWFPMMNLKLLGHDIWIKESNKVVLFVVKLKSKVWFDWMMSEEEIIPILNGIKVTVWTSENKVQFWESTQMRSIWISDTLSLGGLVI